MKKQVTVLQAIVVSLMLTLMAAPVEGWGQVNISAGNTISQNFAIGTSATATLPTGWKADKNTTVRTVGTYGSAVTATEQRAGNSMSSSATNGIYNYAAGDPANSTERAVGGISSSSASKSVNVYVNLYNNGAQTISDFTISYAVEKYRNGSNAAGFSIQMYYSTNGTDWTSAGSDFLTSFSADADNNGYSSAPGSTVNVSSKTLSVSVAAAANLYLAWNYSVTSGTTTSNAQALGIDDVSITANGSANPADPASFTATSAGVSQINLSATANGNGNNIVVVYDGDGTFTTPADGVAPGDIGTGFAGGTIHFKGTAASLTNHTGLSSNTPYYYKAFSYDAQNYYSAGVEANATTSKSEPDNHPTGFTASVATPAYSAITVAWTDAAGGTVPDAYLIKGSAVSYAAIADPADGTPESDGGLVKNITQGTGNYMFTGLSPNTTYYFKIFPYTNSGTNINYKTNETIPTATAGTTSAPIIIAGWDFTGVGSTSLPSYAATTFSTHLISTSGGSDITRGATAAWSTGSNSFRSQGFKNDGISTSNNDYFQVVLTAAGGYSLSLSTIDAKFAGTGTFCESPGVSTQFAYSLDGTNFTLIGSPQSIIGTPNTLTQIDLSEIPALQNVASGTTVTLRYYASGQTTTGGWGFYSASSGDNGLAIGGSVDLVSTTYSGSGNWSASENWNNGLPNTSVDAIIDGSVTIDAAAETKSLTINDGRSLAINPAHVLTVNGSLINNAGNTGLIIKSDATGTGSLLHSTANVKGTVEKYITAWQGSHGGYHFLSSPVVTESIRPVFVPSSTPIGANQDFYQWSEASNTWINTRKDDDTWNEAFETTFTLGKGYLVAYASNTTKYFRDSLNVIDVPVSGLANTTGKTYAGWHLLGNPFPCAIKWGQGTWNKSAGIGAFAQVWNGDAASYKVLAGEGIIPAMNGFMVYTSSSGGSLTIPADARLHSDSSWYKSSDPEQIVLTAKDMENGYYQESVIVFQPGAKQGFDNQEDCRYLGGYAPLFCSMADQTRLALNTLPMESAHQEIPLYFRKNEAGSFRIILTQSIPGSKVMLTDLLLSKTINLSDVREYSFTSSANDAPNRFVLNYAPVGMEEGGQFGPAVSIYNSTDKVIIKSNDGSPVIGNVLVFNMLGQVVTEKPISGTMESFTINAPNGYYIVKLVTSGNILTRKVLVQRTN